MVHLANNTGAPQTARQIALGTFVPVPYLSKVLQSLNRAGLVKAQRGLHGGFVLRRSADLLSMFDVVQAVDPIQRITECPVGIESHGTTLCPLHRRIDDAINMVVTTFKETRISDLLGDPSSHQPLCPFPLKAGEEDLVQVRSDRI